jgi:hypothetical protein
MKQFVVDIHIPPHVTSHVYRTYIYVSRLRSNETSATMRGCFTYYFIFFAFREIVYEFLGDPYRSRVYRFALL